MCPWMVEQEMMDFNFIKKLLGFFILQPLIQAQDGGKLSVPHFLAPFNRARGWNVVDCY